MRLEDDRQGRGISHFALEAMGMTAGDIGEILTNFRNDSGLKAGGFEKLSRTMKEGGIDDSNQRYLFEQYREQERLRTLDQEADRREQVKHDEETRRQAEAKAAEQRQLEERLAEEKRNQQTWQEKQAADKKAMEERAKSDAANSGIIRSAVGLALLPMGLGLGAGVITQVTDTLDRRTQGLGGTMLVTGNTPNAGPLAELRQLMGLKNPERSDMRVGGPGGLENFTPGEALIADMTDAIIPGAPNAGKKPLPGMTLVQDKLASGPSAPTNMN